MTDLITPIAQLAPLVLLIVIPIAAVRLLDTEDLRELGPARGPETTPDTCPSPSSDAPLDAPAADRGRAARPIRPMAAMADAGWPSSQGDA
jgi:hypothetical protein